MNIATNALLPAPAMQNLHDPSGIGHADTLDPQVWLSVRVGPYIEITAGDVIDLYCDNQLASNYTVREEDLSPGSVNFIVLELDQRFIHPPEISLYYEVTKPIGGQKNQSTVANIPVKLTLPGGTDTNPATPWENERLIKAKVLPEGVITSPEGVTVEVAPYVSMFAGDRLTLSWHGELIRIEITEAQVNQPVIIPISKEIIELAGDSDMLEVRYEIRDVVNNWSRWSLPSYVEVEAGNSTLPAPITPQASGMELNLDQLSGADVQVLIIAHAGIQSGDELVLLMERNTAEGMSLETYIESQIVRGQSSFYEFQVPNTQFNPITQGRARLRYRVNKSAGTALRSKSLSLKIIGQPMELAPPRVPVAEQSGGVLDPAAHDVQAQVPAYYFMSEGNDVHLYWMGRTASGANVMHEELKTVARGDVGNPINFIIPDEKISVLAGGSVELYYTVNTFGRAFFKSPSLLVLVSNDYSTPLPLPTILEAENNTLDPANTSNGATVVIGASANLRDGDFVQIMWSGPEGSDDKQKAIGAADAGKDLSVVFSSALVNVNEGKQVTVYYNVTRVNGWMQRSEHYSVQVSSRWSTLPAPTMDTVQADDVVNPGLIPASGATVRVRYEMRAGDRVKVIWAGASRYETAEQTAGSGTELVFTLPKSLITASENAQAQLSYQVSRSGVEQTSDRRTLTVRSGLNFNTAAVTLAGKVYLLPGYPDLLPSFPAGTTVERVASGGTPPYSYRSSNPAVAHVDESGLASVRGKGTARISVSDAAGQTLGYEVTVTGVVECHGVGAGNLTQMSNAASAINGRVPSIQELGEIQNAYGNRWPMGNGNYWSSTVAKDVFGAKWYYVKNLNSGKDFMLLHTNSSLCVAVR